MKIYLLTVLFVVTILSCSSPTGHKEKKNENAKPEQVILEKMINNDLTFEELVNIIEKENFLDSLTFERKKEFVDRLSAARKWEIDSTYSKKELDSIYLNLNIKDFIRIMYMDYDIDSLKRMNR